MIAGANGPTAIAKLGQYKGGGLAEAAGPSEWHPPERCLPTRFGHLEARCLSLMLSVVTGESRTVVIGASMSRTVRMSHAFVVNICARTSHG